MAQELRKQSRNRINGSIGLTSREKEDPIAEATLTVRTPSAQDTQTVAKTARYSAAKGPLTDVFRTTVLKVTMSVRVCTRSWDVSKYLTRAETVCILNITPGICGYSV